MLDIEDGFCLALQLLTFGRIFTGRGVGLNAAVKGAETPTVSPRELNH